MGRGKKERGRKRQQENKKGDVKNNAKPTALAQISPTVATAVATIRERALRGKIQLVYDKGLIYTYNHGDGRPEFYAANVPDDKARDVAATIDLLAEKDNVGHRHSVRGSGELLLWLNLVEGEAKKQLLETNSMLMYKVSASANAPLYELRPRFPSTTAENWGCRGPAPDGMEEMTDAILRKWEDQGKFYLNVPLEEVEVDTIDMDKFVIPRHKLVDLTCALRHIDDWDVDWDENLTVEEIKYVRDHPKFFRGLTRVLHRAKPICERCGEVDANLLSRCAVCHSSWYCSRECQLADWKEHKATCKETKAMRNGMPKRPSMVANETETAESDE